ncbi:hypothetical protein HAX54_043386, partial [Datura stramonium]|nr:hypothetical protein [Datura stramonium]
MKGKLTVRQPTDDPSFGSSLGGSKTFKSRLKYFFGYFLPPDKYYQFQELPSILLCL